MHYQATAKSETEEVRLEVLFQACFNSFEYVPKPDFKEYE